jgi:hypothetical protein
MISGHSYLPNDRDFGHIELSKKNAHIFVPEDWQHVVTQARRKNPFHVTRMNREDFVSLKPLKAAIVNRKVNTNHQKVEWFKIHWMSVSKDKPLQFRYRYSINNLYDGPRAINSKKVADLLELLDYIPPVYHRFYRQLRGADNRESDSESDTESSNED